jgi:NAD(P)-dependent dehydrogenase (short-subunit alcohol dehydrogenase family)
MSEQRTVVVTGSTNGIGEAAAIELARRGDRIGLVARNPQKAEATVAKIKDAAPAATTDVIIGDLSLMKDVRALAAEINDHYERIDVLVNNAGIFPAAELDAPLDEWVRVWSLSLGVNLVAPAILCRAAVNTFSAQPDGGIIVNMASRAAFRGEDPAYWHYAAAKAGIVAMTRSIARNHGRQGVTAFAIAPGYVDTAFNQRFRDEVGVDVAARDTGLGEVAMPQDVANVVAFLASGLARHATGTTIDINGASYVR